MLLFAPLITQFNNVGEAQPVFSLKTVKFLRGYPPTTSSPETIILHLIG